MISVDTRFCCCPMRRISGIFCTGKAFSGFPIGQYLMPYRRFAGKSRPFCHFTIWNQNCSSSRQQSFKYQAGIKYNIGYGYILSFKWKMNMNQISNMLSLPDLFLYDARAGWNGGKSAKSWGQYYKCICGKENQKVNRCMVEIKLSAIFTSIIGVCPPIPRSLFRFTIWYITMVPTTISMTAIICNIWASKRDSFQPYSGLHGKNFKDRCAYAWLWRE